MTQRAQILLPLVTPAAHERSERKERQARAVMERKYWDARLHEMLRWRRPHGSPAEREWVDQFIVKPYGAWPLEDMAGEVLAYVVVVNHPDETPPSTMFSAHVDTVHRVPGRQKITFNVADNHYGKNDGQPLGADCAAGVWLMLEMIDRKVPGAYFFHRGEECGGIGSDGVAEHYETVLKSFKRAVAFDRRGTWSVITHQWHGRCCSDAFGDALADALNARNEEFMYVRDDTGLFTDTANYVEVIPECTNVSVGYYSEHTEKERLDLAHLFALRDALIGIEWEALPVVRDPSIPDPDDFSIGFEFKPGPEWERDADRGARRGAERYEVEDFESYRLRSMTRQEMANLCYDDPELFVDVVRYELMGEVPGWVREYDDNYYDRS